MKVVFVCRANIGRSQMAEGFLNKLSSSKDSATSAGTILYDKKYQEGPTLPTLSEIPTAGNVIESMRAESIDVSNKSGTQVTPEILEAADKIIVMAEPETMPDFLKDNQKTIYWEVEDPSDKNLADTIRIRDDIKDKVESLLDLFS